MAPIRFFVYGGGVDPRAASRAAAHQLLARHGPVPAACRRALERDHRIVASDPVTLTEANRIALRALACGDPRLRRRGGPAGVIAVRGGLRILTNIALAATDMTPPCQAGCGNPDMRDTQCCGGAQHGGDLAIDLLDAAQRAATPALGHNKTVIDVLSSHPGAAQRPAPAHPGTGSSVSSPVTAAVSAADSQVDTSHTSGDVVVSVVTIGSPHHTG